MKYKDVHRIINGNLPALGALALSQDGDISDRLKYDMKRFDPLFLNQSELDATIRVVSLVCEAAKDLTDIQVMLQPEHSTYTDFCIKVVSSGSPLLIIEVKNHETSALFGVNDATAQVLRGAHIALQDKDTKCKSYGSSSLMPRYGHSGSLRKLVARLRLLNAIST